MNLKLPKCHFCKHSRYDKIKRCFFCVAFPDGIPLVDLSDDDEQECANGIKFEEES